MAWERDGRGAGRSYQIRHGSMILRRLLLHRPGIRHLCVPDSSTEALTRRPSRREASCPWADCLRPPPQLRCSIACTSTPCKSPRAGGRERSESSCLTRRPGSRFPTSVSCCRRVGNSSPVSRRRCREPMLSPPSTPTTLPHLPVPHPPESILATGAQGPGELTAAGGEDVALGHDGVAAGRVVDDRSVGALGRRERTFSGRFDRACGLRVCRLHAAERGGAGDEVSVATDSGETLM